jgi:hypothetical protein
MENHDPVVTLCTTKFNSHKFYILVTERISVLYGSQNKQKLFPHTALTDWFLYWSKSVFTVQYKLNL